MTEKKFDIIGIGSAIVDVISYRSDQFIEKHGLHKGAAVLLNEKDMEAIYKDMGASTECSGGCSANTIVGVAMLGGKASFIGKVNNDYGGKVFRKSMEKNGVVLQKPNHKAIHQTARCMIILSEEEDPISQKIRMDRTMAAYLGASNEIEEEDIREEDISAAKVIFLEGFLWEIESGRKAAQKAITLAKKHNVKIALALADPLCVKRNQEEFLRLIREDVDIFFCSESEASALFDTSEERKILYKFNELCKEGQIELAAITRSAKGSFLLHKDEIHTIDAQPVRNIYDVTGAGDLYASGVLYGYLNDMDIAKCGKLGSFCAADVIKYLGARPLTDLKELLEKL